MNEKKLIAELSGILTRRRENLAVAESVTSGSLQHMLSLADKATQFFEGGITAYNLNQKKKHLSVDFNHAVTCNCVSEQTAAEMALGAYRMFNADWSLAVTGYAAPVP